MDPLYRDKKVFERLAQVLEENEEEQVRDAAYGALLRLAAAPERARADAKTRGRRNAGV